MKLSLPACPIHERGFTTASSSLGGVRAKLGYGSPQEVCMPAATSDIADALEQAFPRRALGDVLTR